MSATLQTNSVMYVTDRPPAVMARGRGSWLWDTDGRRYLDFVQGWAVNCLGHSPPAVVQAIASQAQLLLSAGPAFYNAPMVKLTELIARHSGLEKVFLATSGAEANEGAIKLARKWGRLHKGGAHEIITTLGSFHGRTLATMSASGRPAFRDLYEPKVKGFPKVPPNDLDAVRRAITDRTAAVMIECVQGEAGVYPADEGYLRSLRRLADEADVLLIIDEVQTGMGRTGRLFAHQWAGIRPDIMTLGKALGGGVPLAALVASEKAACFEAGDQGGTFCGNPLAAAAGCAVVRCLTVPAFLPNVRVTGAHLAGRLRALSESLGLGEVRGHGLLLALDLKRDIAGRVVADALEAGLLINAPRPDTLRFMPALNVTRDEIDEMTGILGKVVEQAARQVTADA